MMDILFEDMMSYDHPDDDLTIRPPSEDEEIRQCARLMAGSEPWITLRRSYEDSFKMLRDPFREVYVAAYRDRFAGFMILQMNGAFRGYIQTIAILPEWRNRRIGTRLVAFAEERIFRETPNVFICVSSFNDRAKDLYLRLGYDIVGELKDFIVAGHSEILLRKTIAPLAEFGIKA